MFKNKIWLVPVLVLLAACLTGCLSERGPLELGVPTPAPPDYEIWVESFLKRAEAMLNEERSSVTKNDLNLAEALLDNWYKMEVQGRYASRGVCGAVLEDVRAFCNFCLSNYTRSPLSAEEFREMGKENIAECRKLLREGR